MPRLTPEIKEKIKNLTHTELQQIVFKLATKDKMAHDFIMVNYLDKDYGEQELYDKAISDLDMLFVKGYRGYSEELRMANMLTACIRRINEFCKVSKNKKMEADLLVYILEEAFSLPASHFGTCFTAFDSKVAQIVKRLITIVTKKLHEDYKIEYEGSINEYLRLLHTRSRHIDLVYNMPKII